MYGLREQSRPKKRVRSNSNESEKIVDITVSPNKKQKSNRPNNKDDKSNGNKNDDSYRKQGQGQSGQNTRTKPEIRTRNALSKDSVLVIITEIPENTYFNSIKVKVIKGINDVPEKAHKVVAIGVHQTISEAILRPN